MDPRPEIVCFPVVIPAGFSPSDIDADGDDRGPSGKVCPGYDAASGYRPRWGGGFRAVRGPQQLAHRAIDIMAAEGALVVAIADCEVVSAGESPKGGHHAFLRDRRGWVWYMAHMRDPLALVAGQALRAGELVGIVGRTGNAVRRTREGLRGCPHLHLSLTRPRTLRGRDVRTAAGAAVDFLGEKSDPVPFLAPVYEAGGWKAR
jgi:murein DD-endopeptidase MepM/ murein hydrolase activator NlpD